METRKKGPLIYEGKGKKVFKTTNPEQVILFFKDDLTAWQGLKKGSFSGKGEICHHVFCFVFSYLKSQGKAVHWIESLNSRESLCEKVKIFPLEVVVRNRLAGSTAKRLGIKEGTALQKSPLLEYYYKKDELEDPFISEEQIKTIPLIKDLSFLKQIKEEALSVNDLLKPWFLKVGMELVDFKMEFGLNKKNELLLGDDITPDSCRLWDIETQKRLDKDLFRKDLGDVQEGYKTIEKRLKEQYGKINYTGRV